MDKKNWNYNDEHHDLYKKSVKDTILVFPYELVVVLEPTQFTLSNLIILHLLL